MRKLSHFWITGFLLFMGFLSCKEVPEGLDGPYGTVGWDTTVLNPRTIQSGDSLVFKFGFLSPTTQNQLYFSLSRVALAEGYDFFGPDSDWVFIRQRDFNTNYVKLDRWGFKIPDGLRPGMYKGALWFRDANGKLSDTSYFSFPLANENYPLAAWALPADLKNAKIKLDTITNEWKMAIQIKTKVADPAELCITQWKDSTGTNVLGEEVIISPVNQDNENFYKTDLFWPDPQLRKAKLRAIFQKADLRRVEYQFFVKKP